MNRSQRKGKNYEREIAKRLSKVFACNVRRTPCSGGLDIKGDLRNLSGPLEPYVFECKKQESLNIWACMRQAENQAASKVPVLIFSRNNTPDYVCMRLEDWMQIVDELSKEAGGVAVQDAV